MTTAPSVPELLRRGAMAPRHVDPLDAVMGEDWAVLSLGRGSAERRLAHGEVGRQGARRKRVAIRGVLAPNPQSLIKLIGSGGTTTPRGLRAQMAYLERQGDVPLRASESMFGIELGRDDADALAAAWGLSDETRSGADRTSHFLVSFPIGTDPEAAERAGRAWAQEFFDSGAYGDRWDYYTAFHTDRPHPHLHVVVCRRGLDAGAWLKVAARGEINYERMREVQVLTAEREGIYLTDTRRVERGLHERPVPDAEFRRALAEGRAPVAPEHTARSAIVTAAEILEVARIYESAGATIREAHPDIADTLAKAARSLVDGQEILAREHAPHLSTKEAEAMVETIAGKQSAIRENFQELEQIVNTIPDALDRLEIIREVAELKGCVSEVVEI